MTGLSRRSSPEPAVRSDRGSATVWVLTWCALLWFVALAVLLLASVRVDRHHAAAAADLAALAAAQHAAAGGAPACAAAEAAAEANGAVLDSCAVSGPIADIEVTVEARLWPGGTVTAHSRAGPASLGG